MLRPIDDDPHDPPDPPDPDPPDPGPPDPPDPVPPAPPDPGPPVSSITTWMRLEPRSRNSDMSAGLQARIYDPLWLLARQWQLGEFQGEDNGSPASARWRGEAARATHYYPGPVAAATPVEGRVFDGNGLPLEALVERERVRPQGTTVEKLRLAATAGQQFLRMLDQQALSKSYRDVFKSKYAFPPLPEQERGALDNESLGFLDVVLPRVPDGRRLYAAMRAGLPADLGIAAADAPKVQSVAEAWLRWYEGLFSEPGGASASAPPGGGNPAWSPERMEYGFSLAARMADGEKVLTAREHFGGPTDWHDFSVHPGASLRADGDPAGASITHTTIPAPVSYRGMPSARFWEFEDAQVDFGAIAAGPEDLARMLLIEFAMTYGNDWFVIPVDLPVGSLCRTSSLVVTNTFGERTLIRPSSERGGRYAAWRMFQLSAVREPGKATTVPDANLFFLASAPVNRLESRPIEEVLFLRDEMANLAWGVERVVESATERPLNRFEQRRVAAAPPGAHAPETAVYRLATEVPEYWVPLLPVQSGGGLRLQRGKVLRADGAPEPAGARGRILNPDPPALPELAIYEEEIPREGIRVTRHYRLARSADGATHLWVGRRKVVGRGEGSSGLKFDTLSL